MDSKQIIKALLGVVILFPFAYLLLYRFGPAFDGYTEQRETADAVSQSILKSFVVDQQTYLHWHGEFDQTLHKKNSRYNNEKFRLAYASESQEIAKLCSDCIFEKKKFKIGLVTQFHGEVSVWTIDDTAILNHLKRF